MAASSFPGLRSKGEPMGSLKDWTHWESCLVLEILFIYSPTDQTNGTVTMDLAA